MHWLNAQYVISATRGLSVKTKKKGQVAQDHGRCCLHETIAVENITKV